MEISTKTTYKSIPVVETEYKAFDGKVFKEEKQCLEYESDQKQYIQFRELIDLKYLPDFFMSPNEVRGDYSDAFTFTFNWDKLSVFSIGQINAYMGRLSSISKPRQLDPAYLLLRNEDSNGRYVCIEYNYFQSNSNGPDDNEWSGFFGTVEEYMSAVKTQLNTLIELDFITL